MNAAAKEHISWNTGRSGAMATTSPALSMFRRRYSAPEAGSRASPSRP